MNGLRWTCRLPFRFALVFAAVAAGMAGCSSKPKTPPKPPTTKVFRLVHHTGGTHHRTVAHGDYWYQTFDRSLLVLAPKHIAPLQTVDLGKVGETGPAIDMIVAQRDGRPRLLVVIEDDEVVELSLEVPLTPEVVNRIGSAQLGIRPRRLSRVNGEVFISGRGGVVRWRDLRKVYESDEDVSRVAVGEAGLIACVGRRAFRLSDDRYVGSASELLNLNGADAGTLVFARQGEQGVLAGLMSSDLREIDAQRATTAVPGRLQSVRVFSDRLWIVTDETIGSFKFSDGALHDADHINIVGACDVAQVDRAHLAVAGTFGRALYRLNESGGVQGGAFVHVHREPGRLSQAITDGRYILAGSREGLWMYLINSRVEMTSRQFETLPPPPQTSATVANARARISDDGRSVTITPTDGASQGDATTAAYTYRDPNGARLHCVAAIDGDFWIGHDRGVTVLKSQSTASNRASSSSNVDRVAGQLRCAGPVLYIYPLLVGGGASFVSEFGGFGVARFVDEPIATTARR